MRDAGCDLGWLTYYDPALRVTYYASRITSYKLPPLPVLDDRSLVRFGGHRNVSEDLEVVAEPEARDGGVDAEVEAEALLARQLPLVVFDPLAVLPELVV